MLDANHSYTSQSRVQQQGGPISPPSGLVLIGCALMQSAASRWVALPARAYPAPSGEIAWAKVIDFKTRELRDDFLMRALAGIDLLLARGGEQ